MKIVSALILSALFVSAHATESVNPTDPVTDPTAQATSSAEATAEAVAGSFAEGGSAVAGSSAEGGDAQGSATINEDYERSAPGIAMSHPQATMDCMRGFGVGGSNVNGSLILGPQWKDGDCMASSQFTSLAELDLPLPAAKVYCARKRFAKPFGSVEACESAIEQSLINRRVVPVPLVVEDTACTEKLSRCENITGRK